MNLKQTAEVFCDGGVIKVNPSPHGGTWAYYLLDENGVEIGAGSGFVLPANAPCPTSANYWHCGLETVSNNVTELVAVVFALQHLPEDFDGVLHSDSHVTLCRMRHGKSWKGVPQSLIEAAMIERERHSNVQYVLLDGHPTAKQLEAKIGKRGNPCSPWNVKCDKRCGELAKLFLAESVEGETS